MTWKPDLSTREEVSGFVSDLLTTLPDQLGIDEVIAGCEVLTIPAGALPKYLDVALGGDAGPPQTGYTQAVLYRGGITGLAVGDYVTVIHLREGNRYEVMGPGGAAGAAVDPAPVDAHYVTTAGDARLTDEHILSGGRWTLAVVAAGTAQIDFRPDCVVLVDTSANNSLIEYSGATAIQDAITAADVCDVIWIPPGTYNEDITLKDSVCVKGFGPRDKIRITGDVSIVTTASGGWLENVTIVMTDPPNTDANSAVHEVHNGTCNIREITIIGTQTAARAIRGIGGTGAGTGTLVADDIIIDISSAGNQAAYGVQLNLGSYEIEMKNFKITVDNTNGGAIADAVGIAQASSCVVKATEGWLNVTATGAGTATDIFGTVVYSEVVMTDGETEFSDNTRMAPDADSHPNDDGQGFAHRFVNPLGLTSWSAHFRPGETTGPGNGSLALYAWQGAPFVPPVPGGFVDYSRLNDWLYFYGAGGTRMFLGRAFNARGTFLYARVTLSAGTWCGLRVDDGTDNNYYEFLVQHVASSTFNFRRDYQTGGLGVNTVNAASYPVAYSVILVLYSQPLAAPNHRILCYVLNEAQDNFSLTTLIGPSVAWVPARAGLVGNSWFAAPFDWFKIG